MKKILFFLVFWFIGFGSFAQNWVPASAKWACYFIAPRGMDSYYYNVTKELLFKGHQCQKIDSSIYVYESNDTVYFYHNGLFRPTYYYNARVGDTVSYYNAVFKCSPQDSVFRAVVTGIDTLILSNQIIRSFHTTLLVRDTLINGKKYPIYFPKELTYTEKIGSNYIYPYFLTNCVDDQATRGVCNYADSTLSTYYLYPDKCKFTSKLVEKADDLSAIRIYPNPSADFIRINTDQPVRYLLYNLFGQVLTSGSVSNQQIDIRHLPNANYWLVLYSGQQRVFAQQIVKIE